MGPLSLLMGLFVMFTPIIQVLCIMWEVVSSAAISEAKDLWKVGSYKWESWGNSPLNGFCSSFICGINYCSSSRAVYESFHISLHVRRISVRYVKPQFTSFAFVLIFVLCTPAALRVKNVYIFLDWIGMYCI